MAKIYLPGFLLFCMSLFFCLPAAADDERIIDVLVSEHDTLESICNLFLEDPRQCPEIKKINRLGMTARLTPGHKLMVPVRLLKGTPADGMVTFVKGDVQTQSKESEEWYALHLNDVVTQGSGIKTGSESTVEVTFEDGTSFFLRPDTSLLIKRSSRKASTIIRILFLKAGRIISNIKEATGRNSRYEIETSTAIAAARGTAYRVSIDSDDTTRTEVLKGTIGVEAMKQEVEVATGEGTLVRKNEPPMKPRKLLPPPALLHPESLYNRMPLRFQFEDIHGANAYRVMLARDMDFKDVVKTKVIEPGITLEMINVNDGTYYLQSRSIDADGLEGLPSAPIPVRVRANPFPPYIERPDNLRDGRGKKVTLTWLEVQDADRYHLQIADDRDFHTLVINEDHIKNTNYTTRLPDFKTYYFKIRSIANDSYAGGWSDVLHLTIIPPPNPPSAENPAPDGKEIHLVWPDHGEGMRYHFQMARDENFTELLIDRKLDQPQISMEKPEDVGRYFIRTKCIDREGHGGDFPLPQRLEIKQQFPYKAFGAFGAAALILWIAL